MGLMELGNLLVHQVCGHTPESGSPHIQSQVRELGCLDSGTDRLLATDGKQQSPCRVRGQSAGQLSSATD